MDNAFTIKAKIWRYPGVGGWHFVTIEKKIAKKIKDLGLLTGGFGSMKVRATLGKSEWKTSIFPTREKEYLLAIKASVRKAEEIKAGDTVELRIVLI